jgi:hypothetical protein
MRDPTTNAWKDATLGVQCTPECPSDLALDAMHVDECTASESALLMGHIAGCNPCEARWDLRQQGLDAFKALDRDAMIAKLHRLSAELPTETSPSFWQQVRSLFAQPAVFGTSMAMFAIVMMLVTKPTPGPLSDIDESQMIRAKGASFTVFKSSDEAVEILANGSTVYPGDKLRFKISPREGTEVMVVGQEVSGKLYMAFPLDGSEASRPSLTSDGGVLPGTIELDQSSGREKLYLISCDHPFGLSSIEAEQGQINVPKKCSTTSFELNKVSP